MNKKITFTINGSLTMIDVDPDMKVIDVIRNILNLTRTKHGCDNSTCGTCTIVVNGKAMKSCNMPVKNIEGAEILTIEGLAKGLELHPIQKAIAESGAIQCGFCTPGIVMELFGLFEENPSASQTEIENMLNRHLCRCTGYEPIRDGALIAQKLMQKKKSV